MKYLFNSEQAKNLVQILEAIGGFNKELNSLIQQNEDCKNEYELYLNEEEKERLIDTLEDYRSNSWNIEPIFLTPVENDEINQLKTILKGGN